MKKLLKIIGWTVVSILCILVILFLLARFAFRRQTQDYLNGVLQEERAELLRTAGPYTADTEADFRFSYPQDTLRAQQIHAYFRLDTLLRPHATTWENALAAARFVARHIPHANQTIQPEQRNAIALWEYHNDIEPAFNCRLHSIMLHELLLAAGIVNRFVTCLPEDPEDADCHVVNIVWLPELHKWAMLDSDMRAYITDPAGTPLSLEEMRECYIKSRPMDIHCLLDQENTSYYRAYWAKNLYWFECWEQAGYDIEPHDKGRTVALLPPGFDGFNMRDETVKTAAPGLFWATPDTDLIQ